MTGNDPVYEILAYNTTLGTTQRQLLENYEATTWNLESQLPTSGYTVFNPPAAASFNKNLVGIGCTSPTDNVLSVAAGFTDGLGFSSSSGATGFLNTAGFLMAAHNGQSNTVITPATIPGISSASSISLWNRSWYIQPSGGNVSGQVTINFNFSDYNGGTPNGSANYSLLYNSTDGTFATGTNSLVSSLSTTVSGQTVSFAVNASNLSNGYYSIIYSLSVLPLVITNFTVSGQGSSALLDWDIQDGTSVDHFDVQRSTDGANFSLIGTVAARADVAGSQEYTFTDGKPAAGLNYYRLAVVNTGASLTYSGIRTFDGAAAASLSINIYPIPVSDMLHILTNGTGPLSILIVDEQGKVMQRINAIPGNTVNVAVSDWPKGVYFAELLYAESKYIRSFVKE